MSGTLVNDLEEKCRKNKPPNLIYDNALLRVSVHCGPSPDIYTLPFFISIIFKHFNGFHIPNCYSKNISSP